MISLPPLERDSLDDASVRLGECIKAHVLARRAVARVQGALHDLLIEEADALGDRDVALSRFEALVQVSL